MKKKVSVIIISVLVFVIAMITFVPSVRTMAYVMYINTKEVTEFSVENDKLYMNGLINSKTFDQLQVVVKENPQVKTIVMLDVPGSADDEVNLPMSSWVRQQGLNTYLTSTSHVASGGTDFFLAGVKRTMEEGARIGVHSWADGLKDGSDIPKSDPAHEMNRKYIEDMLGQDDFYWYTIYAAPAADMHYMDFEEINEYGLVTEYIEK